MFTVTQFPCMEPFNSMSFFLLYCENHSENFRVFKSDPDLM